MKCSRRSSAHRAAPESPRCWRARSRSAQGIQCALQERSRLLKICVTSALRALGALRSHVCGRDRSVSSDLLRLCRRRRSVLQQIFHTSRKCVDLIERRVDVRRDAQPLVILPLDRCGDDPVLDRKSTRLNSSHTVISYAVFCLKKKKKIKTNNIVNDEPT